MSTADLTRHPYLVGKGFAAQVTLVTRAGGVYRRRNGKEFPIGNRIFLPICDRKGHVFSGQLIDAAGRKLFLPGGKVRGGFFGIRRYLHFPEEVWLCEGYSTGLSVLGALNQTVSRDKTVAVCFSAGNIPVVAKQFREHFPQVKCFVVADHDRSRAGEKAARKAGLSWWMPPNEGMDANDFEQAGGDLVTALHNLRMGQTRMI